MRPSINHLTQLLDNAKNTTPNHQAFVGLDTSISYKKLYQHSISLANYLSSHADNGTVAIMMPNLLSFPVGLFGIWYSDKTITLINPLYTSDEVLKQCLDAQVKTIIIAKIFYKTLKPILKNTDIRQVITVEIGDLQPLIKRYALNLITCIKRNVFLIKKIKNVHHTTLHKILNNTSAALSQQTFQNTVALLQYTGGTSGVLKAATLEHKNILANIHQLEYWLPKSINQNSLILTALPLYHIFALTINCLLFVHIKGNNILVLNPRKIKQLITPLKKYHVDVITGVNTLFGVLVKHKDFKILNWSTLKVAISGGMSLDKNISDQWQSTTGKPIVQGYGLTECSPVVSAEGYQTNKFSGSVGKPLIETKIKILDKSHQALKTNEIGEISIKGPQVMASYWHKQTLNQQVFTQDGYFLSGDMGYMDEQGRIFIVDRLKDMIIVSGFNVYSCEVEQVLNQHSDVVESACVGIEHEISGQIIKAFVVKKPSSKLEKQALIDYCKEHLAHYKIPRKIQWIDSLPKSNIGKILKRKLTG
ncbi:MAG: Long-chain-fatty-acid--CoA ligase [Candidatus Ruthia sp. Asou_11_S2]|nr:Long-chain-fatty-acid--CoA ligase [Candidatus Ruthia sp. Asou_11_S2]